MSVRAIWAELVRRREAGDVEVPIRDLTAVHPYAHTRVTHMVATGDIERVRKGVVRIRDSRLPEHLRGGS